MVKIDEENVNENKKFGKVTDERSIFGTQLTAIYCYHKYFGFKRERKNYIGIFWQLFEVIYNLQ